MSAFMKKCAAVYLIILNLLSPRATAENVVADVIGSTVATPVVVVGTGVAAAIASVTAPVWIPITILTLFAKDQNRAKAYEDYVIKMSAHAKAYQESNWSLKSPSLDFFFIEYRSRIRAGQTKLPSEANLSDQQLAVDTIEWAQLILTERLRQQQEQEQHQQMRNGND